MRLHPIPSMREQSQRGAHHQDVSVGVINDLGSDRTEQAVESTIAMRADPDQVNVTLACDATDAIPRRRERTQDLFDQLSLDVLRDASSSRRAFATSMSSSRTSVSMKV